MDRSCIAIIPARGGSKRIPRKNIIDFAGKPMIAHSIKAALDTGLFARVVVSTDDEEIAKVARRHGAEVPFVRPATLADDYAGTTAVIAHALEQLQATATGLVFACCIYATAPFLRPDDLVEGFGKIHAGNWQYVFSAGKAHVPVFRSFAQDATGGLAMLFPEHQQTRSQDLPDVYYDAGQFYWGRVEAWLERKALFKSWSTVVVLPDERVHDIDTEDDLARARRAFELLTNSPPQC